MVPVKPLILLASAIAVALLLWLFWPRTSGEIATVEPSQQQHEEIAGSPTPTKTPVITPIRPSSKGNDAPPKDTTSKQLEQPTVIDAPVSNAVQASFANLEAENRRLNGAVADWRFDDYRAHANKAGVSGEAAYQAYLYVKSCVGSETSVASYDAELVQLEVVYDRNRRWVSARELEARLNQLEHGFERCEGLGEDPLNAAVEWLQLAADLSYLPAQIGFYRELPELLRKDRWAVFRRPDFLDLYHQRTPDYMNSALSSGHPEAFRHYASAIAQGIVFETDPVLSLAYEHAAELAQGNGQYWLPAADPESGLGLEELREARQIGEALCEEYCR